MSVVVPVFNEAAYVRAVLDELLAKQFVIPHEVIVVESNSTDGTREIVQTFEGRPGLRIIYEDRPRGKGAAVRRGLTAATGTIVLIQDADFEYDLDDYDALLEPIVQRRTSFVLGSRSLGLDDWKVRRFARSRVKALPHERRPARLFARIFNVLYQQRVTDVATMFKVFRRECIEGVEFVATGFNFDIELACMLVKNGYSPMEVPVNYVARGFDEGKKIDFRARLLPVVPDVLQVSLRPSRSDVSDDFHFASEVVDITAHDLPGLKAAFVVGRVADGSVVLDVGCGGGKMLRTINEHRRGVTLLGCDVDGAHDINGDFTFTALDRSTGLLPYDDSSVDIALLIDVLEHVDHPETTLSEIARILRPNGRMLAFVPIEGEPISWFSAVPGRPRQGPLRAHQGPHQLVHAR